MKWSRDRGLRAEGVDPEKEEIQAELRKHSAKKEEIPSMEELIAQGKTKGIGKSGKGRRKGHDLVGYDYHFSGLPRRHPADLLGCLLLYGPIARCKSTMPP